MYQAKTKPTAASVSAYIDAIENESRRTDCRQLVKIMGRVTRCKPKMWGTSIVGFDQYHYKYASGHEGEACIVGFSSRQGVISVYMAAGYDSAEALLAKLGKHKIGNACLYIKQLSDVRVPVLEELLARAVAETKRRYPRVAK